MTAGEPIVLKNKNDREWGKVLQRSHIVGFARFYYTKVQNYVETCKFVNDYFIDNHIVKYFSRDDYFLFLRFLIPN